MSVISIVVLSSFSLLICKSCLVLESKIQVDKLVHQERVESFVVIIES